MKKTLLHHNHSHASTKHQLFTIHPATSPSSPLSSITTLSEDEIASKNKGELVQILLQVREEVHGLTQEKQGLTQEIHALTQALAVYGSGLGLEQDSDLRSVLYDLALSQQARASLAIDLARRTEKMKSLQKTVSTLSFVREANNLELLKCERKQLQIKDLEQQVTSQQTHVSLAAQSQDKLTSLVAAHHQLSEQLTASQLRAASAERERDHLAAQIPRITLMSQDAENQRNQQLDAMRTQHAQQLDVLREQHKLQMDTALEQHTRREQYAQREVERHQQQLASMRDQHLQQMEGEQVLRDKREQQGRRETEQMTKHYEFELGCLRAQLEQGNAVADKESARIHTEHDLEKGKLQERLSELIKETEKQKEEIIQLKSIEGDTQRQLALLRGEHARQGRINSFQEVVGAQMANVRTQLDEAKKMYSRVHAENALLAAENARLLVMLDEEIKSRSTPGGSGYPRATSPHVTSRPSSTPPLTRSSSFIDTFTPSSLKIPYGSSPLSLPSRPSSAPNNFISSPATSPRRRKHNRSKSTSPSNPASRSSTPEPSDTHSSTSSSDFSFPTQSDNPSSSQSASPIPLKPKSSVKRSPLIARRVAARASPAPSPPHSSTSPTPTTSLTPTTTPTPTTPFVPTSSPPVGQSTSCSEPFKFTVQFTSSNPFSLPPSPPPPPPIPPVVPPPPSQPSSLSPPS